MSNFFAALDSDDEGGQAPAPVATKKKAPKKVVVEPSKMNTRPNKEDPQNRDRHTKGGRTNAPASRDGKRQYDRKSGTGRGKEIKKGGGGGHNWGSDKQDAKNAEGPVIEGKEEADVPEEDPTADAEGEPEKTPTAEEPEPEPEPEVDNTISYEEYLAQKARPDSAAFQPVQERQLDVSEFAGKAAGSKKETEEFILMGEGKKIRKKGKGKKEKATLVLDFQSPGRGGRGGDGYQQDGRGGGRGGRGYGRGRGGRGGGYEGGRGGRGGGYEGGRGGRGGGYEGGRGGRGGGYEVGRGGRGGRYEGGRGRGGERREGGRSGRGSTGGGRGSSGGGSKPLDTADVSAFPSL